MKASPQDKLFLKDHQNDKKAMTAIRRVLEDRNRGRDYLLLPLHHYSIEDIYDALIEAGYRWSDRYQCWHFQGSLEL